jgi:hypothetical protein
VYQSELRGGAVTAYRINNYISSMKPAFLVYFLSVRKGQVRKNAEAKYQVKHDLNSSSPAKAPIIV